MGKEKPNPMKLSIKATDIAKYKINNINFKIAKFNNFGSNGEETLGAIYSWEKFREFRQKTSDK